MAQLMRVLQRMKDAFPRLTGHSSMEMSNVCDRRSQGPDYRGEKIKKSLRNENLKQFFCFDM